MMHVGTLWGGGLLRRARTIVGRVVAGGLLAAVLGGAAIAQDSLGYDELASLPASVQPSDRLVFDVLMDGNKIGEHRVVLGRDADRTHVAIDVDLDVKFGPFTLYTYTQKVRELWKDGTLERFKSATDNDGENYIVEAVKQGDDLKVVVNGGDAEQKDAWFPTTYWNRDTVRQQRLVATLNGETKEIRIEKAGQEEIEAGGRRLVADRYRMRGDLDVDLWYDKQDRWVKLAFDFKGNRFDYILQ